MMKRGNHELLGVLYRLLLLRRVLMRVGDISETCCILRGESALANLLDNLNRSSATNESTSALNCAHFRAHWKLVIRCMYELVLSTKLIRPDHIVKRVVGDNYGRLLRPRYGSILLRLQLLRLGAAHDLGELKGVLLLKFI